MQEPDRQRLRGGMVLLTAAVCSLLLFAGMSAASDPGNTGGGAAWVADELLLEVRVGREKEALARIQTVAEPVGTIVTPTGRVLVRLRISKGLGVEEATRVSRRQLGLPPRAGGNADHLVASARVAPADAPALAVQPNFIYHTALVPTDPFYAGVPCFQYAPEMIHAPEAWAAGITGAGIIIAVLDTGLRLDHQEFAAPGKVMAGPDYANGDNDPNDDNGHGTKVAGTAAALANGLGMVGVAPGATVMPVKVIGGSGGTTADIAQGMDYAVTNGARVVNLSLGNGPFDALPDATGFDGILENTVRQAEARGVVVVAASGNNHSTLPFQPASFAAALAVGAVTPGRELAEFSNGGPYLSVVAPGVDMYTSDRFAVAGYGYSTGTSQAAPVVAGAAALVLSAHPALTPAQVRAVLEESADDLGPPGADPFFGHGMVNVARALGLTVGSDLTPAAMLNAEFTTTALVATFSKDMLTGGGTDAVDRPANWTGGGTGMAAFLSGASAAYADRKLTLTNTTNTLTPGVRYTFGVANTVRDAGTSVVVCNYAAGAGSASRRSNDCGASKPWDPNSYGYATAACDTSGVLRAQMRFGVEPAGALAPASYTLMSAPTNTSGGNDTGGTTVSLAGASLAYDSASRVLTVTGVPDSLTTQGNSFALIPNAGLRNADLGNPIRADLMLPSYGLVEASPWVAPSLVTVANSVAGNNMREVVRLRFNKPLQPDAALFSSSNYAVRVGGAARAIPPDTAILVDSGRAEVLLTGFDLSGDDGASLEATVSGLHALDDGTTVSAGDATATGTVVLAGSDYAPDFVDVAATTNSLFVQFPYYTKMDAEAVADATNWTLLSDGSNPPATTVSLAGKPLVYDSGQNALRMGGLGLTAGNYARLVPDAAVVKRFPTRQALGSTSFTVVVGGNGDFSPAPPVAASVRASAGPGPHNAANQVNAANRGAVSVDVVLPSGAEAGQVVRVTLADSSEPPRLASWAAPLAAGGAQTVTVGAMNATSFATGPISVTSVVTTADGHGSSDILEGAPTVCDETVGVGVSALEIGP